jgi:signal transduction histidine kinase
MAGLLRRQVPDSPDAQMLLADIMSEAKLANAIVVEMLEFVRPIRLQVEPTHLDDVLRQAVMLAEAKVPRRAIILHLDVQAKLPPIDGDQHQLCQLFSNLLINAFEALDGHGRVDVVAVAAELGQDPAFGSDAPSTPAVLVEVVDDGPGVPADLSDRIFTPFFSTKPKGSGLGLSIVRKIVDAHDGRIDLSSAPGSGTRFRVTLPIATASPSWFKQEA